MFIMKPQKEKFETPYSICDATIEKVHYCYNDDNVISLCFAFKSSDDYWEIRLPENECIKFLVTIMKFTLSPYIHLINGKPIRVISNNKHLYGIGHFSEDAFIPVNKSEFSELSLEKFLETFEV